MKTFFCVFFAILSAATVIFAALWSRSKVNSWETAWRSCEAQISAIVSADAALRRSSEYPASISSSKAAMDAARQARTNFKRIEADRVQVAEIKRRAMTILENKPFGLPLTTLERKELAMLKEDIQRSPQTTATPAK